MSQLSFIFERLTPKSWRQPLQKSSYRPLFAPTAVDIPISGQHFSFTFEIKKQKTVSFLINSTNVHFYGPVNYRTKLKSGMRKFLISQAKEHILPRVKEISRQTGLIHKDIRFKNQKSLWGSCSDLGNINFNIRLLFLPLDLIDYVITHELCHLEHMNHSKAFWSLVRSHMPDCDKREKVLNQAHRYIPKWVFTL